MKKLIILSDLHFGNNNKKVIKRHKKKLKKLEQQIKKGKVLIICM